MRSGYMSSKRKVASAGGGGGGGRVASTAVSAFELKSRVIASLNKLADRDTQQIGVEELARTIEGLSPEGIAPFLSCVADTDSEQKSAVRKECVRLMAALARVHGCLLVPYLGKMVASIVKRLKDVDSVVRDACLEAFGALAKSLARSGDGDGVFAALAMPLFDAMAEQNKYLQVSSASCLARVVDMAGDRPHALLQRILSRALKFLKSPHFMAKPAAVDLIRSIVQAGGAITGTTLSASVNGILEALKSNDWTTRKAASVALASIAVGHSGDSFGFLRNSCLRCLDSCRFDKVKPVRDAIHYAIKCWKTIPGINDPETSENASSTKDDPGIATASDGGWRETTFIGQVSVLSRNSSISAAKGTQLTERRSSPSQVNNDQHMKSNNWNSEIPIRNARPIMNSIVAHNKDLKGSSAVDSFGRITNASYDPDDNKQDSSTSDLFSSVYDTKDIIVRRESLEGDSANSMCANDILITEEINAEPVGIQERNSSGSTVTELCSCTRSGCCQRVANDLEFIKSRLLNIETTQSHYMDLMQAFMANSMDTFATLQLKIHDIENSVEKIAQGVGRISNCPSTAGSISRRNQIVSSSSLSSCTPWPSPRPSVDSNFRQPFFLSSRNREVCTENSSLYSWPSFSTRDLETKKHQRVIDAVRDPRDKGRRNILYSGSGQAMALDTLAVSGHRANPSNPEGMGGSWRCNKELLCTGDVESAYAVVLRSGDELGLIEVMDRTGPVLDKLSPETTEDILNILMMQIVHHRRFNSLIPWLQQVVELSAVRDAKQFIRSSKSRKQFVSALKEAAVTTESSNPVERVTMRRIAAQLCRAWGDSL